VLIPEVQFKLEGPTGLLAYIEKVLENKGHAVICIAEGAGQVGAPWRRTN
jgi:6-phosphofructokinase 1